MQAISIDIIIIINAITDPTPSSSTHQAIAYGDDDQRHH
jgi:hypothetical protein